MPGVFELALPRSAVENSSELTRSLQLNEEVIIAMCIAEGLSIVFIMVR